MTTHQPAALPELPGAFGYLCDWGNDSFGLTRQTVYYDEPGSATLDDWNEYPKVHENQPIYTADQMRAYALAALQSQPAAAGVSDAASALFEVWRRTEFAQRDGEFAHPDLSKYAADYQQAWAEVAKQARAILALRPQPYHLPDDLYDSKCWRQGNYASRVEWLHTMYEHAKHERDEYATQLEALRPQSEPDELSPDFTDTARAALLWVLWHHQGGSSPVGQPIRYALGMGAHESLNAWQVSEAKRWAAITGSQTSEFHNMRRPQAVPMTDDLANEFAREMVKGGRSVEWLVRKVEAHHFGITAQGAQGEQG